MIDGTPFIRDCFGEYGHFEIPENFKTITEFPPCYFNGTSYNEQELADCNIDVDMFGQQIFDNMATIYSNDEQQVAKSKIEYDNITYTIYIYNIPYFNPIPDNVEELKQYLTDATVVRPAPYESVEVMRIIGIMEDDELKENKDTTIVFEIV